MKHNIVILGPTASGKTAFAVRLAARLNGSIISVDSRQVYRGLDIGSGKDIREYTLSDGTVIPSYLLDIADPEEDTYSLADFMVDSRAAAAAIRAQNRQVIYAGGTALYLDALLRGYQLAGGAPEPAERARLRAMTLPELHAELRTLDPDPEVLRVEPSNRTRIIRHIETLRKAGEPHTDKELPPDPDQKFLVLGTFRSRAAGHSRIERRLDERIAHGMIEEAVSLHDKCGVSWEKLEFFGLEYRYMALHLQGKLTRKEMRDQLLCKIRQFAKRQDSWFRKMERDGQVIYWLDPEDLDRAENLCRAWLAGEPLPPPEIRLSEIRYSSSGREKKIKQVEQL